MKSLEVAVKEDDLPKKTESGRKPDGNKEKGGEEELWHVKKQ